MRVLLVHNYYGSGAPSGENQVVEAELAMLRARGHEVELFTRHSDEIRLSRRVRGMLRGAASTVWNPFMARAIRSKVDSFCPDVVHVHNTFPLISPAVFHAIEGRAARVLTLHNYRLFCPAAIPMRAGVVCTECLDRRSAWPALRHGCYRGSRLATLPLAISVGLHRWASTWRDQVDAFVALTEFQKQIMTGAGLPGEKVYVKPNFYPGTPRAMPWAERGQHAVFVGRLAPEKGVETLLRAWLSWGEQAPDLHIVGDGPARAQLEELASGLPAGKVRFLGAVSPSEAERHIASARLLLLPSLWFEGFPMVLREALAFGTPAAVSNLGSLPGIVQHGAIGLLFEPGDAASLLGVVRDAWSAPDELERLGQAARSAFSKSYTEDVNYRLLMQIYRNALTSGHRADTRPETRR